MPRKKTTRKKPSGRIAHEVAEAVEQIPELVSQEAEAHTVASVAKKNPHAPLHIALKRHQEKTYGKRRRFLWAGVTAFTALVFGLWILQTQAELHDIRQARDETPSLLQQGQDELSAVLSGIERSDQSAAAAAVPGAIDELQKAKTDIQAVLAQVLSAATSTSSTASTTSE